MIVTEKSEEPGTHRVSRYGRWIAVIVALIPAYVFSSGPIIAAACWLRDKTGWDGFWMVFFLYYPLYPIRDVDLFEAYIMWWMKLFGTMGPG
jgi:hypothetical protein